MLIRKRNSAELNNLVAELMRMEDETVADEEFLVFARSIVADYPFEGNDQFKAILHYVKLHVGYQPDPSGTEMFTSPHRMQELIKQGIAVGDCDCQALFCVAICRALGYNAHVVLLDQTGTGFNHAACEVYSETVGEKYYMDATRPEPLTIASTKMRDEPGGYFTPAYRVKLEVK